MPAFNQTVFGRITSNVRSLFHRRTQVGGLHLTTEEYLATFVPREARDLFRDTAPLMFKQSLYHRFGLNLPDNKTIKAVLQSHGNAILLPRIIEIQPDAPPEIVQRIYGWIDNGGDVSRDFGRVNKVFAMLNTEYSRVGMRYYWPTILALCSEGDMTKDLVQPMQELRTPATLRPLPRGLAKACRQTAETISTARLIPADASAPVYEEGVTLSIAVGQTYTEDFGTFHGEN